jgi:CRP/FNR family transcriptional regulator
LHLPGKVAYCLLLLARDYGVSRRDGTVLLPLALNQGEIASMIGSSRECVNRVFGDFKKSRLIRSMPSKQVLIQDEAALRGYCEGLLPQVSELEEMS